jgi:hypothetical protein
MEQQYKYNVGESSKHDDNILTGLATPLSFYQYRKKCWSSLNETRNECNLKVKQDGPIQFSDTLLIPKQLLPYQYHELTSSDLNQIVLWDQLKQGNAKKLSKLLKELTPQFDIEVNV